MSDWDPELLRKLVDAAPEGIVLHAVRGEEHPVVYANPAFERMSGYGQIELLGSDWRRLLGSESEQPGVAVLRAGLMKGASARALLRCYRKDGLLYWDEVVLEPLRNAAGELTHVVAYHRDVGERDAGVGPRPQTGLPNWLREDRLSGLCTRAYFEELLRHDWLAGQREARSLTLMMFDIDALGAFNDTFGRSAGDACIRRVAGIVGSAFRRGTDIVARWEGGTLCALVRSADPATALSFAQSIAQRVQSQHIHHPRSARHKFVTVSAAVASLVPNGESKPDLLLNAAYAALRRARKEQAGNVISAQSGDFAVARAAAG